MRDDLGCWDPPNGIMSLANNPLRFRIDLGCWDPPNGIMSLANNPSPCFYEKN